MYTEVAFTLYCIFEERRFGRIWQELPEECRKDWLQAAYNLDRDLRAKGLCLAQVANTH